MPYWDVGASVLYCYARLAESLSVFKVTFLTICSFDPIYVSTVAYAHIPPEINTNKAFKEAFLG